MLFSIPAGAFIKKRFERCGFVAPWRETFLASGATFVRINDSKTNANFFFNQ
jgi:hypothetical protein